MPLLLLLLLLLLFLAGSVRLRLATTSRTTRFEYRGRLEINWGNSWGSVCYDSNFTRAASELVCQQIGLRDVIAYGSARLLGWVQDY